MSSSECGRRFGAAQRGILLEAARASIVHGLTQQGPLKVKPDQFEDSLRIHAASFVTLEANRTLRGCIGSLNATRPLIVDVTQNAYAAAFSDPRFPPLVSEEFPEISVCVSVLSAPEPIQCTCEDDLLAQLRPGTDGVILEDRHHRGTFLPVVWHTLRNPAEFLAQLKLKAGLPRDYWSSTLRFSRYTTETIE